ncbi:MAG: hypothetical protein NTX73_01100 [Rhodobacterales bacterium]|nr:hypothetical protein [Rhodobacterales bacterium]
MSVRIFICLACLGFVTACGDGQPLFDDGTTDDGTTGELPRTVDLPPGTENPSRSRGIERYEARNDLGGGLITNDQVAYNEAEDTFTVDNLAFDGENVYSRDNRVPTLRGFNVYEADVQAIDPISGDPVGQIVPYRALVGESTAAVDGQARSSFAIVRTGGYVDYGFGGFVYERNGSVVLPTSGQATFSGDYAGVRVFSGQGGLEYTTGDMTIDIDFDDFNANDGVKGTITNREAFTVNGTPIQTGGTDQLQLPTLTFTVVEGATTLDSNGELSGNLSSSYVDANGNRQPYESGTYYGIIAGDMTDPADGGEIVGVIVIESKDPRYSAVTAQETGGFILYR